MDVGMKIVSGHVRKEVKVAKNGWDNCLLLDWKYAG